MLGLDGEQLPAVGLGAGKAQMPARAVIRSGSRQFWRVRNMSVPIISHSSAPGFWA